MLVEVNVGATLGEGQIPRVRRPRALPARKHSAASSCGDDEAGGRRQGDHGFFAGGWDLGADLGGADFVGPAGFFSRSTSGLREGGGLSVLLGWEPRRG